MSHYGLALLRRELSRRQNTAFKYTKEQYNKINMCVSHTVHYTVRLLRLARCSLKLSLRFIWYKTIIMGKL